MLSIIIPVYNGSSFIETCLQSVLSSTYKDIEIIIIDDGSIDDTYNICQTLVKTDGRIHLYQNQTNRGVSYSKNYGLLLVKGEYVCFVDADDILSTQALELLYQPEYDFICGDFKLIKNNKHVEIKEIPQTKIFNKISLLEEVYNYIDRPRGANILGSNWGKLYKTSILKAHNIRFNEKIFRYEDIEFNLDYTLHINNCLYISDIVYTYITNSQDYGCDLNNFISVLEKMKWFLEQSICSRNRGNELLLSAYMYFFKRELYRQQLLKIGEIL